MKFKSFNETVGLLLFWFIISLFVLKTTRYIITTYLCLVTEYWTMPNKSHGDFKITKYGTHHSICDTKSIEFHNLFNNIRTLCDDVILNITIKIKRYLWIQYT